MDTKELNRLLDDVTAGRQDLRALERVVSQLDSADLRAALDHLAERAGLADERRDVVALTRLAADLLTRWAAATDDPVASAVAAAAEILYRTDLDDPGQAAVAAELAGFRSLDPAVLAGLLDRGTIATPEARLRLLEVVTTLGDGVLRQRFEPPLKEARAGMDRSVREAGSGACALRARDLMASGDADGEALNLVRRHLEDHPTDRECLRLLAELRVRGNDVALARSEVTDRAAGLPDPQRRAILSDLACVLATANAKVAIELFEDELSAASSRGHLDAYVDAMHASRGAQEALPLLERLRSEVTGRPEEATLLPVLGRAYALAGRTVDAERAWRRLRAVEPRNLEALAFYEEYHRERGDDQKLFTTLQFALSVVDRDAERIRIAREMAVLAEDRMHNLERAIDAWKRVLALDSTDAKAIEALVAIYEKTGRWTALVEFHNERLRRLPPEAVEERVAILFQLIAIYQDPERLPNPENVLATYARIVEVSPTNEEALETLARGYTDRERWADLLKVLQKKVVVTQDPVELLELFQQIAEIAITRMSNETQAIPFLERVLELDPENLEVVRTLKRIYEHKHNQEKLFALHLREMEMLEGPEREAVMLAAAEAARDRLLRHDEALRLYEEVYRANPGSRTARENLHMLYTRLERWADYAAFLVDEIERPMPGRRRIELMQKLGEIRMDRQGEIAGARKVFEDVLALEPGDDIAARRLEHLYLDAGDLDALRAMFRARKDSRSFVALLAQREPREPDLEKRVRLNLIMAETCREDLADPVRATRFLTQAFSLDPSLTEVGRELLATYSDSGDRAGAAEVLMHLASGAASPDERAELWGRRRDLLEALGRHGDAMQAGLELLRVAGPAESPAETVARVRASAEAAGLWQEFASLLQEAATAVEDADLRRDLLLESGRVLEGRLLFHDEAREVLDRVLDLDPACTDALDLAERIAMQQEDFVALESVLRRRVGVTGNVGERQDVLLRLGRLYEDLLGDDDSAAECYRRIVEEAPDDRHGLAGLHRTLERAERYAELAEVIASELETAASVQARSLLRCELADLLRTHLDDFEGAVPLLRDVLAEDPDNADALRRLVQLFEDGSARDAAANVLAPFYRRHERFEELFGLLEARLPDLVQPEMRAAILLQMADIREHVTGDPDAAFGLVAGAVALHPFEPWALRLSGLADATGRHADAARILGRWVGILPDGVPVEGAATLADAEVEARLAVHLGRIFAKPLRMRAQAIQAFEKALPFVGADEGLLQEMLDLYLEEGNHETALATMDRLADLAEDEKTRRQLALQRADYARSIGRIDEAIETLRGLVDFQSDPEAEARLDALYREAGRFEDLLGLLAVQAERSAGAARESALLAQAGILVEHMDQPGRAAPVLRSLLADAPDSEPGRALAERIVLDASAAGAEEWAPPLAAALEAALLRDPYAQERRARILVRQADLATGAMRIQALEEAADILGRAGRPADAFFAMRDALRTSPGHSDLLRRTVDLGVEAGLAAEVADGLEALAEDVDVEPRCRLLLAVAGVARGPMGDATRAVGIYDRLLELNPGCLEVMREMDALLAEQGRDSERVPLLAEMAEAALDLDEQRRIRAQMGELCRRTGDVEGACQALEWVLDRRPAEYAFDEPASRAAALLLDLYDETGREAQSVALRRLLADVVADPAEARDLLLAASRTLAARDPDEAWGVLRRLLDADPADGETLALAKSIASGAGDDARLATVLTMQLAAAPDDDVRREILPHRAGIRAKLGEAAGALEDAAALLALDAGNAEALAVAARLLDVPETAAAAVSLIESADANADIALRIRAAETRVRIATDDSRRAAALAELGEMLLDADRPGEAADALGRVFVAGPADEAAFERLIEALAESRRTGEIAALTREVGELHGRGDEWASLCLRSGIALIRAGLADDAANLLEEASAEVPESLPVLEALAAAYQTLERPRALVATLSRMAEVEPDEERRIAIWLRAGGVAREEVGGIELARDCFMRAFEADPLREDASEPLAALLAEGGDAEALRALREREVAARMERGADRDSARVQALLRDMAARAAEAGDGAVAVRDAGSLLALPQRGREDVELAEAMYRRFDAPAPLYHALVEALSDLDDKAALVALHRFAASRGLEDPTPEEAMSAAAAVAETADDPDLLFDVRGDRVLSEPSDAAARDALIDAARRFGREEEALSILDRLLERTTDLKMAFELAGDAVDLAESADSPDAERILRYLVRAHEADPSNDAARERLVEALRQQGRHLDAAGVFEALADREPETGTRCERLFQAIDCATGAGAGGRPVIDRLLGRVLDVEPANRRALEILEASARDAKDGAALARLLARRLELADTIEERRERVLELADVQERQCNDRNAAVATLDRWLDDDPVFDSGWRRLESLLLRTRRYADLASMYAREADALPSRDLKVATLKKAASIQESHLRDMAAASETLRQVLRIDPANAFAFTRLSEGLEASGDWTGMAELLRSRLEHGVEDAERTEQHVRLGTVLKDHVGDFAGAVASFSRALEADPTLEAARGGLESLLDVPEVRREAATALEAAFEAAGDAVSRRALLWRLQAGEEDVDRRAELLSAVASLDVDRLHDASAAMDSLAALLALRPGDATVAERLETAAEASGRYEDLYRFVSAAIADVEDPEVSGQLHRMAARIAEERLAVPARAAEHLAAYLDEHLDDAEVLEHLERLYAGLNRSEDQVRVVKARLASAGDDAPVELRLRLAELLLGDAYDPFGALDQLRLVIQEDPGSERAIALLKELSESPVAGRAALDIVVGALRESGDREALLWACERAIEAAGDADTASLHDLMASTAHSLGRGELELEHLGKALARVPSDEGVLARMLALGRREPRHAQAIVDALRTASAAASWPELEKSLLWQACQVGQHAGLDVRTLDRCVSRVLAIDPLFRPALDLADALYSQAGRHQDLAEVLEQKLRTGQTPEERGSLLRRLAKLHEERRNPAKAAAAIEEAAALAPDDPELLRDLGALRKEEGDFAGLAVVLGRLADLADDAEERRSLLLEAANLYETNLEDLGAARAILERLRLDDPEDGAVLVRLERIYEGTGDYDLLARMLTGLSESDAPIPERVDAAMRAATVFEVHLQNPPAAIAAARRAFELDPRSRTAIDELVRLYYQFQDWSGLVDMLRHKANLATATTERIALLRRASEIADGRLGDLALAGSIGRQILEIDPKDPRALLIGARVLEEQGRSGEALLRFQALAAGVVEESPERIEALVGLARLGLSVGDTGRDVRVALQAVLQRHPEHPEGRRLYRRLLADSGDHAGLAAWLEGELERAGDDAERANLCMEIADLHQNRLNDGGKYLEWAERAFAFKRDNPRVVAGIVNHHLKSGNRATAIPYLEWLVNFLEGKRRLRELPPYAHELGRAFESQGDLDKAAQYYRLCHEHDATNVMNALALARLHMKRENHDKALRIFQPLILRIDSLKAADRIEVLLSLARIHVARDDRKKARQFVMRVLAEEPDNAEAQGLLAKGL